MAYGVLDSALTALDWAMTASDVADMASLAGIKAQARGGSGIKVKQAGRQATIRRRIDELKRDGHTHIGGGSKRGRASSLFKNSGGGLPMHGVTSSSPWMDNGQP
jgi:hypothetical protein